MNTIHFYVYVASALSKKILWVYLKKVGQVEEDKNFGIYLC